MSTGTVLWFEARKGYGFIRPSDSWRDIFVHAAAVERSGLVGLFPGQVVAFEVAPRVGRHVMAVNLRLLAADAE